MDWVGVLFIAGGLLGPDTVMIIVYLLMRYTYVYIYLPTYLRVQGGVYNNLEYYVGHTNYGIPPSGKEVYRVAFIFQSNQIISYRIPCCHIITSCPQKPPFHS